MITTRTLDILGFVAGISFLITGIIVSSSHGVDMIELVLKKNLNSLSLNHHQQLRQSVNQLPLF
jgi:hypothetical protein